MALSKQERVRQLAHLVGITIAPPEETQVADRFDSLIHELERLNHLDLGDIQPLTIFPEEDDDEQ